MKKIKINDTFYNATKDSPILRSALINMGFKPMSDEKTYQTVGRLITLKKAIKNIGYSLEDTNKYLAKNNIAVEIIE